MSPKRGVRPSLFSPHVERYLLVDEGEFIVDEIVKHAVCMILPILIILGDQGNHSFCGKI